ncbi:TPA: CopG family transcriptional regulator [Escherichia coli]|uniref:CopG family transcriptional regulator n=1 Tax=Klebsiella michiganensis TaxID=1134687 RepID=UPI0032DB1DDA|nr:CopG family transcriptional regulator [Escherichia coli]HAV9253301.1 CopG family transcriptional regulator [Escherichia coli]HAW0316526.1 CopG family transcriptional regulator [Escherichia coli]HAW1122917.1 CopG family transcriptional regulator [Escherichia coli]HCH7642672.1 CopG family transcriptional regulator [Escherichia coli]
MALQLNRPVVPEATEQQPAATSTETARFISEASKKPVKGKGRLANFRLTEAYEEILEAEAIRTGQSKTTVLKAALAMYNSQDENIKNHWLLESAKLN